MAAIIFGIAAWAWPGPTLSALVYMFGGSSLGVAYRLHRVHRDVEKAASVKQTASVA